MAPKQKPGKSRQDYQTPIEFVRAVRGLLGIVDFDIDLAADTRNRVCREFYSQRKSAFDHTWRVRNGWNWCNPPFTKIGPWVERGLEMTRDREAQTCFLLPASVSSNWFAEWAHQKALVLFVRPRLTFVGCDDPYPKDLMLLLYSPAVPPGYDTWRWDTP